MSIPMQVISSEIIESIGRQIQPGAISMCRDQEKRFQEMVQDISQKEASVLNRARISCVITKILDCVNSCQDENTRLELLKRYDTLIKQMTDA